MDHPSVNGPMPASTGPASGSGHAQAALILVETLMHTLLEKNIISKQDFIDIVDGAAEVEDELTINKVSSNSETVGSILAPLASYFRNELEG